MTNNHKHLIDNNNNTIPRADTNENGLQQKFDNLNNRLNELERKQNNVVSMPSYTSAYNNYTPAPMYSPTPSTWSDYPLPPPPPAPPKPPLPPIVAPILPLVSNVETAESFIDETKVKNRKADYRFIYAVKKDIPSSYDTELAGGRINT